MPQYIIHKDGAYNVFSTVVDAPFYEPALTLDQLREQLGDNCGADRLERAHSKGCSAIGYDLGDCISGNRAGPNESELPFDEFVQRFLTLPAVQEQGGRNA